MNFPSDKWSGIAFNSSLGMSIAAQQAPVGNVAYALHQQNQLDMMLQASLSHMAPIQFGLGGYAHKSYPTYGPMMLGLGNLSPGDGTGGSVQQVSGSTDVKLEEVQAKRGKDESDSGKTDWLASSAKGIFNFFTEDIQTLVDPEASAGEKIEAAFFTVFKPAKVADKVADVAKGIEKAADTVDDVKDVGKAGKGKDLSKSPRNKPGVVNESFKLDRSLQTQTKLMYNKGAIGIIPKEIRNKMIGKHFNSFDDFRKEFWKSVASSSFKKEFNNRNVSRMLEGNAPIAPKVEHYGKHKSYILHHKQPIDKGGEVYNLDNLMITSPKMHQNILDPTYHFGKKGQ